MRVSRWVYIGWLGILWILSPLTPVSGAPDPVVLTLGSWRTDDVGPMNEILSKFHEAHPGIRILFDPTPAPEYDAVLAAQLQSGTGPDLFYL